MANQYKNHIVYFGDTLIDLRSDTVTAETLLEGYTAHDASGAVITGTYVPTSSAITVITTPDSHGGVIKEIVAVDISNDTVTAAALLQGYTAHDRQGNAITGTYVPPSTNIQANKNVTPTESAQEVTPDTGYDALAKVTVGAISSTYIGSDITRRSGTDLTASGATVTVPAGYYASSASKSVSSGIEGTPTATKGNVSNHAISVTPSVTNAAGYISGGTKTGIAVSVSASELVSGSQTITSNGTVDVTNLSSVTVALTYVTYYTGSTTPSSSLGNDGDIYLKMS